MSDVTEYSDDGTTSVDRAMQQLLELGRLLLDLNVAYNHLAQEIFKMRQAAKGHH